MIKHLKAGAGIILTIIFLTSACSTTQYTVDNLPQQQIAFGEGGGVTGAAQEYVLLPNGQIFSRVNFTELVDNVKRVPKGKAGKLFERVRALNLEDRQFIHPGNSYTFIQLQLDSTTSHRAVWGRANQKVPTAFTEIYSDLKSLVKMKKQKGE